MTFEASSSGRSYMPVGAAAPGVVARGGRPVHARAGDHVRGRHQINDDASVTAGRGGGRGAVPVRGGSVHRLVGARQNPIRQGSRSSLITVGRAGGVAAAGSAVLAAGGCRTGALRSRMGSGQVSGTSADCSSGAVCTAVAVRARMAVPIRRNRGQQGGDRDQLRFRRRDFTPCEAAPDGRHRRPEKLAPRPLGSACLHRHRIVMPRHERS
jgi:hypothetical protein